MSQVRRALIALISVIAVVLGFAPTAFAQSVAGGVAAKAAPATAASAVHTKANAPGPGYWLAASDGSVFAKGAADSHGSTAGVALNHPIVGIAATPSGNGYWMVASDGGIFSFGDAAFHGSTGAITLNQPIVGMTSTPSGHGYWLVAADGGIFSFGDAAFHGSTGAITLNQPIVGMTSTPSGHGYWLVAADGGIFSFGDAKFHGSTGAMTLNKPITGIASTPTGNGYWMVASDGGIFSFGDAHFYGSTGAITLNQPIVGMAASSTGKGYWFVAADGGIFTFGDAHFFGSANTTSLNHAIVGMAASAPKTQVVVPPAATLDITTNPSNSTGGVDFATQPVVHVLDAKGHTVVNSSAAVTLSIASPPNGVVLSCDHNTVHAVDGVATFAGCSINTAGSYTLHITSGSLTPTSSSVAITVGPAAQIGFTQEPNGAQSQVNFTSQPHVASEDAGGNLVTSTTGTVTLSLTTPAGATLACTSMTATYTLGEATFAGCHIDRSGTYNLHAVDTAGSGDSTAVNITAAGAAKLAFTTQPSTTATGGVAFTVQPHVTVQDAQGNTVLADNSSVTLTISTPGAEVFACTLNPKPAVSGVATFGGCNINLSSGTAYTLHAADNLLTAATSGPITVSTGPAVKLAFTAQPGDSTGGIAGAQPTVTVQDAGGNTATTNGTQVTLTLNTPNGATMSGCTTNPMTAVAGVAAFTGCKIDLANATPYTLHAADGLLTVANSAPFTISVGSGAALAFTTQPTSSTGGVAFGTQPAVTVRDAGGNTVGTDTSPVTLTLTNPNGATLTCDTNPQNAAAGVAAFAGCTIDLASGTAYTLHAAGPGLTPATSGPVTISVGSATQLAFIQQPSSQTGGVAFGSQPHVAVQDAGGNTVVGSTDMIGLTITTPGSATLTCTSANPLAAVSGVATFAGCNIDLASGTPYTLDATDGVITQTSGPVTITVGPAARIAFVQQPSGAASLANFATQPHVATEDAGGNVRTGTNAGSVTLSLQTPVTPAGAVLTCTSLVVPYVNGVASFTGCNIDLSGTYNLHGDDGTFTATSNAVSITAAGSAKLVFSTQPGTTANGGVAFAPQPVVQIQDSVGNVVAGDTSSVTLTLTTANGATLTCVNNPQGAVAGVATFSGCNIDLASATPYTLNAADAGLTPATSGPITITAGAAAQLAFVQQPSDSTGGVAFTTQPHVAIQDAAGNTVAGDASSVALSLTNAAGATLACTSANPLPAVNGVANFTGCKIDLANNYTLHADDGLLTGADSATVTITAGAAAKLGFVQQPSSSTGGVAFGTQPHVAIQDAGGNTVTGNVSFVTLSLTNAAGATLTCTSANPLQAVAGVANFTGCNINLASATPYTLHAIDGGLTAVDSGPVTITAGTAASLGFTTQPGNSTGGVAFAPQPAVTVRDAGGNTVAGDTSTVSLTLTTAAGAVLTCSPQAAVAGVATFVGCSIDLANNYTLRADDGVLTFATSATVTIGVGPAVKLAFIQQPSSASTGGIAFATQPHVAIQDAGGNTTGDTSSVNLTLTTPAGASLGCTTTMPLPAVAGVASYTGCKITVASATPYTLHAAVTGLTAATSTPITISIGPAFQVAFTNQPSASSPTNTNFGAQPQVKIEDAGGNVLTGNNTSSISLDLTRPSTPVVSVLSCDANTVVVVAGVANFTGCSVDTASTPNYTLRANDTTDALIGTSSSFVITG